MSTTRTYDMTGWNDDKIERGERVDDGWYHTTITDVIEDYDTDKITIEYTIAGGSFQGQKVYDRLNSPDRASSASVGKLLTRLHLLRAKRLGILPAEDQREGAVNIDWLQLIGRDCYLKIQTRTWEKDDGSQGSASEPMFDGVYSPDDDRIPEQAKRHEPCPLTVLSEADQKRAAEKDAAKAEKAASKPVSPSRKRQPAAAASAPAQTDFGDI